MPHKLPRRAQWYWQVPCKGDQRDKEDREDEVDERHESGKADRDDRENKEGDVSESDRRGFR